MYNPLLTTFVAVADCGSFQKAAQRLYLSPPSVMKQVNRLEKHLALQLFERSNQGITLTPAGQIIYQHAKTLFSQSQEILQHAKEAQGAKNTVFSIGSSLLNPCKPFMDLWYQLSGNFPGYKLQIVPFEDDHEGILDVIAALGKQFDFLVGVCDSAQWLDRCSFLPLGYFPHCVAVSRTHPLAKKNKLELCDLYGQTLMLVKEGDSQAVDSIRAMLREHPQIQLQDAPQFYDINVFNRCEQEQCVMLTISCWAEVHPALKTIPVAWDFPIPYGLMYAAQPSKAVQQLVDTIKTYLSA